MPKNEVHAELYPTDAFSRLEGVEDRHFWFRERNRLLLWCAEVLFPRTRRYLELGCGTGYVLKGFAERFPEWEIGALEYFDEGLAVASKRIANLGVPVNLEKGDARNLSKFRDLDLIGAYDVLEHIEEDETVVSEAAKALKPGGGLLITVPQHMWLWSARDDSAGHKRRYTRDEITTKLEAAGFEIVRVTSFVSLLLPAMLVSRWTEKDSAHSSRQREFALPSFLNRIFGELLKFERALIRSGVNLPLGGSLLVAARLPVKPVIPASYPD